MPRPIAMYFPVYYFAWWIVFTDANVNFRRESFRMSKEEESTWEKQVKVLLQEKAWCNENVQWKLEGITKAREICFFPTTPEFSGKIL